MASVLQQQIIQELNNLPLEMQIKVRDFAYALKISIPKGTAGKELLQFAGIMSKEEAKEIEKIIEEGCEQIDEESW